MSVIVWPSGNMKQMPCKYHPADVNVNSSRGNKYYGECSSHSTDCLKPASHEAASDTETYRKRWAPPLQGPRISWERGFMKGARVKVYYRMHLLHRRQSSSDPVCFSSLCGVCTNCSWTRHSRSQSLSQWSQYTQHVWSINVDSQGTLLTTP